MNPIPISKELRVMLQKHGLCSTPQDELMKRFKFAKVEEIPATSFATHMRWMLTALLKASPATESMKLIFVDGMHLEVNVGLFQHEWRVHDNWLTWQGTHENSFCDTTPTDEPETFTCNHAVLKVWDMMMTELMASEHHSEIAAQERELREMARIRLSQMPRSVGCVQTDKKGQLRVTWTSTGSHQNRDKPVNIILHHTECVQAYGVAGVYRLQFLGVCALLTRSRWILLLPWADVVSCQ
jgi:hypothetical protein